MLPHTRTPDEWESNIPIIGSVAVQEMPEERAIIILYLLGTLFFLIAYFGFGCMLIPTKAQRILHVIFCCIGL